MKYPKHLTTLIQFLRQLPGVGNKTAERYAFQMMKWKPETIEEFSKSINELHTKTFFCNTCNALMEENHCFFCTEERLSSQILCIVPSFREVFAIESTREYSGSYHVLGGLLSPLEGWGPERLNMMSLIKRIQEGSFKEIIIGMDATLEGDATALFLKEELKKFNLSISRLAFGIPMGSSLDYIDGGTLALAFSGRINF